MGLLTPKKRVNRDRCSFATKQHMFGVFAIDEPGSSVRALYAALVKGGGARGGVPPSVVFDRLILI